MHHHEQYHACEPSYCLVVPTRIAECSLTTSALPPPATLHPPLGIYHMSCSDGELPRPLPCCSLVSGTVGFVHMGDFGNERVIGIGIGEHRADRQKD